MMLPSWQAPYVVLIGRLMIAGLVVLLAFGLFERWPKRLPHWLARWFLQVLGVAIAVPFGVSWAYWLTTMGDPQPSVRYWASIWLGNHRARPAVDELMNPTETAEDILPVRGISIGD